MTENLTGLEMRAAYRDGVRQFDHEGIRAKLSEKRAAIVDTQRVLLEQLAELPGAICIAEDKRDLSRILNEVSNDRYHMDRWIELVDQV